MKMIMIVDDEPDQIYVVKTILERNGDYNVIVAHSGQECFDLLERGKQPDLILLDLMMPGMNGWDVFHTLKKRDSPWNDIPIIFLTADSTNDSREAGERYGEDYIEKPMDGNELKQR
ncbi:MAG: response regulator, partial [Thermoplasmatales archaeon]|nr:response regulator [Thermoplasmatales archaeon]